MEKEIKGLYLPQYLAVDVKYLSGFKFNENSSLSYNQEWFMHLLRQAFFSPIEVLDVGAQVFLCPFLMFRCGDRVMTVRELSNFTQGGFSTYVSLSDLSSSVYKMNEDDLLLDTITLSVLRLRDESVICSGSFEEMSESLAMPSCYCLSQEGMVLKLMLVYVVELSEDSFNKIVIVNDSYKGTEKVELAADIFNGTGYDSVTLEVLINA